MRAGSCTKRQRGNTRSSTNSSENNSTESEREMEEVDSESEQIPGGGKQDVQSGHVVSKNTKCWLFFEVPPKGTTKSGCSLCGKSYKCVDGRNKLTTSTLKTHLLRQHGTNPQVRAAYLLDEEFYIGKSDWIVRVCGIPWHGVLRLHTQQVISEPGSRPSFCDLHRTHVQQVEIFQTFCR